MGKVKIETDIEEIKKVISQLSEDEKEALFFELNPAWSMALEKMEKEAIQEDNAGKTISLSEV
ncbi:hypothetical protein IBX65_09325 [Candidatus Aerophobetes bacterium]|nr:hypothetical protein [Candidatus Aerophobetes bacterium]